MIAVVCFGRGPNANFLVMDERSKGRPKCELTPVVIDQNNLLLE